MTFFPPMELLAPVGTLPGFEAALQEGADAVYVGAPGLNARALARDFSFAEIAAMCRHAQADGRKFYVAMNSLMKEDEVRMAMETLTLLADIKPDALIIQDLGLLHLIRRFFPGLKVHASTLMTVNNSMAAQYYHAQGFERIVLARELSMDEIGTIHRRSTAELEIFIHGAMCFSYSGLCRFSSLHGGKSSLRGQCVQPCRRRYDWLPSGKRAAQGTGKGGGYFFSMNDLSGIELLSELRAAGVVSLKIEGRLKSVEYVRNTVRGYRLALDALDKNPDQRSASLKEAHRYLDAAMGRKRSSGFFLPGQQTDLILPRLSGNTGEVVGKIIKTEAARNGRAGEEVRLVVTLQTVVSKGDRLRLHDERSDQRKSFTLRSLEVNGKPLGQGKKGQTVVMGGLELRPGSMRHPFQGMLFRVDISGRTERQGSGLAKSAAGVRIAPPDPVAITRMMRSLSVLESSADQATKPSRPTGRSQSRTSRKESSQARQPLWWFKIPSLEAAGQRFPVNAAAFLVDLNTSTLEQFQLARRRKRRWQIPLVWALPPVITEAQLSWYHEATAQLRQSGELSFQIGHPGQIALFQSQRQDGALDSLDLYGDYSLNALNSLTLHEAARQGLAGMQFSLESDRATLVAALTHFTAAMAKGEDAKPKMKIGMLLYGRPPLFTARIDAPHFHGNRTVVSSRGERFFLDRSEEAVYVRPHSAFSLLHHAQELAKLGVNYFVVDVSQGQLKKECAEVTALLSGRGELPVIFSGNYAGVLS